MFLNSKISGLRTRTCLWHTSKFFFNVKNNCEKILDKKKLKAIYDRVFDDVLIY